MSVGIYEPAFEAIQQALEFDEKADYGSSRKYYMLGIELFLENVIKETNAKSKILIFSKIGEYLDRAEHLDELILQQSNEIVHTPGKHIKAIEHAFIVFHTLKQKRLFKLFTKKPKEDITPHVFGVPLKDVEKDPETNTPKVAKQCIEYLQNHVKLQGIFRISASGAELDELKKRIDNNETVDFNTYKDPHTIACLLKAYIRELPEPILTYELYNEFLLAQAIQDENECIIKFRSLVALLPPENVLFLRYLITFILKVSEYSDINFMTIPNLTIVFGPSLLNSKIVTIDDLVSHIGDINNAVRILIQDYNKIF